MIVNNKFTPTHKVIGTNFSELVQIIPGKSEFYDLATFESFQGEPVALGNYGLDEDDETLVLVRDDFVVSEDEIYVGWKPEPSLKIIKICFRCHSERIVKNGKNSYGTQRYKCHDCGYTTTGTPMGRPPIGDRAMTNEERQRKFQAKKK